MLELLRASTASLVGGWSETQVVLLVLALMLVGVALLSYFVIAPECEKRLEKQFAAMVVHEAKARTPTCARGQSCKRLPVASAPQSSQRLVAVAPAQDVEAALSDDDASSTDSEPADALRRATKAVDLSRRRKSEGDALRQASFNKAEMLRRRVLLRKLEEEIDGAIQQESNARACADGGAAPTPRQQRSMRLLRRDSLGFSDDRLKEIQEHSVDCTSELELLAQATDPAAIRQALATVLDVLTYYSSVDHRDINKVTVFCNSLLKHDGLNHLRSLESADDLATRTLANQIIEKAVPAIWH